MFIALLLITSAFFSLLFILLLLRAHRHRQSRNVNGSKNVRLAVVLGSGGHTTEILRLVSALGDNYDERFYILADTDSTSLAHVNVVESRKRSGNYKILTIPRSREVRQSYVSSVWTTLVSLYRSVPIVYCIRPQVVLCNGPGTCIPICTLAYLVDLVFFRTCRIIFVESICRVKRLSLSGKILYYLRMADVVLVQWPQLLQRYPRALYISRF